MPWSLAKECCNQIVVLLVSFLLEAYVSVIAVAYSANVLFVVFLLSPADDSVATVHSCNKCLLHMTVRVACSLSLYGWIALYNRDAVLL
jgi:hypothetical protein